MKKVTLLAAMALVCMSVSLSASAQNADTLYFYKGGQIVIKIPIAEVDSFTFSPQAPVSQGYGIDLAMTAQYGGASYSRLGQEIVTVVYKHGVKYFLVTDNTIVNHPWSQIKTDWQSLSEGYIFKLTYTYSSLGPNVPAVVFDTPKNPGMWTFQWLSISGGESILSPSLWDYNGNSPLINNISLTQNSDGSLAISYQNRNNVQRKVIARDW